MLKNFWYAVAWDDEVTREPTKVTVLGQELVLYRDTKNSPVAMSDLCIHRGAALSGGWVQGDCIVCPYHAWTYASDGACVRIPAAGDHGVIPKKARMDAYPAQERYGWVWVFMGDLPEHERPPLPDLGDEFDDPSFRKIRGEFMWDANYERVTENGIDATHVNWVHNFNDPERAELTDYDIEISEWKGQGTYVMRPEPSSGLFKRIYGKDASADNRPEVVTTTAYWMPNIVKIHIRLPLGNQVIYDTNIPIDEHRTRTLWIGMRDFFTQKAFDWDAKRRVLKIFKQDADVVEAQRPELLPVDFAGELHHKTDELGVAYRKRRHQLMDAGWGIDTHKIASFGGKKATVIPSPARRENPEMAHAWVMKEVPTTGSDPAELGAGRPDAEIIEDGAPAASEPVPQEGDELAGQQ
jgi:phenylpropionate dioxygenase-like ring-hydroxylating dioxygenase large terminal subunit